MVVPCHKSGSQWGASKHAEGKSELMLDMTENDDNGNDSDIDANDEGYG